MLREKQCSAWVSFKSILGPLKKSFRLARSMNIKGYIISIKSAGPYFIGKIFHIRYDKIHENILEILNYIILYYIIILQYIIGGAAAACLLGLVSASPSRMEERPDILLTP